MRRIKPERAHYIPKGARKIAHKLSSAVVYAYERDGRHYLIGFSGKRQKPDFHFRYANDAARLDKANRFFEAVQASEAFRIEQRQKRNARPGELAVGDVLKCSWGYDQTNVDYYEVTKLIGKSMVEIRAIRAESEGEWIGKSVPLPGAYCGEPMRKRVQGNAVAIYSFANAYKIEPVLVGGVKTYGVDNWTAYA